MLRMYGTGPIKPMSQHNRTCHIVNPDPAYERGLCGAPIVDIIGEYNAVPSGWDLCEGCYVEAGRHRTDSSTIMQAAVDAVEQLLRKDLPRARKRQYGGADDHGFYPSA